MQKQPIHIKLLAGFYNVFFHLLYHQFAWAYDWVANTVSVGMWIDWVQIISSDLNAEIVLELGHGPGHLHSVIPANIVIGLDKSKQMGRIAKSRLKKQGLVPHLTNGDAQLLPFASDTFDKIVATFPTEYITHQNTLAEIKRTLIPDGKLYIVPAAWITGKRWTHRFMAWLFKFTGQAPHKNSSVFEETKLLLEQAGFTVHIFNKSLAQSDVIIILCENIKN